MGRRFLSLRDQIRNPALMRRDIIPWLKLHFPDYQDVFMAGAPQGLGTFGVLFDIGRVHFTQVDVEKLNRYEFIAYVSMHRMNLENNA